MSIDYSKMNVQDLELQLEVLYATRKDAEYDIISINEELKERKMDYQARKEYQDDIIHDQRVIASVDIKIAAIQEILAKKKGNIKVRTLRKAN